MNEKANRTLRAHNVVVVIITVACIGAIIESLTQGWELWAIPLIAGGVIACWALHINRYGQIAFRENFFLIFSMLVAFFHGAHVTSFYDAIVISAVLMISATVIGRREYLPLILMEFYAIIVGQIVWAVVSGTMNFTPLNISRIILHLVVELCIYMSLLEILKNVKRIEGDIKAMQGTEEIARFGMEDFLSNISHELRTPVNVINGMSSLILKKETRSDVIAIRDAGLRLSHQIEDIQDYSEIDRGDAVLETEKYMITELCNDIAIFYNEANPGKDIELVIDLDPEVPAVLKGDAKKLKKIIMHLIENGVKFTRSGVVCLKITGFRKEYGINLIIEVSDTGIGMSQKTMDRVSKGSYQANKKRIRSTGGIGLGLSIVYGFTRLMNGYVSINSEAGKGTTVKISVVQEVLDPAPCISITSKRFLGVAFYASPKEMKDIRVFEFYRSMAYDLATGLRLNFYSVSSFNELKDFLESGKITHLVTIADEYRNNPEFYESFSGTDITVTVIADRDFQAKKEGSVIVMPKPLYSNLIARILNGEKNVSYMTGISAQKSINLDGVRALVVDDEPMNLIVARGLFKEYNMVVDTADSGAESILKFDTGDYDIVFMDHMMPEMDGVEAMKRIKFVADKKNKKVKIIALTANATSGAREMFLSEGFDGFISKPINISDFERVMNRVMSGGRDNSRGGAL